MRKDRVAENSFVWPRVRDTEGVFILSKIEIIEPDIPVRPDYLDLDKPLEDGFFGVALDDNRGLAFTPLQHNHKFGAAEAE